MKSLPLEVWDDQQVQVCSGFAELFRAARLTTYEALWTISGTTAKNLRSDRVTLRFELTDAAGQTHGFYLKRFAPQPFRERLRCWLRWTWPIWGARPEWNALYRFHELGLPTMTPVLVGERAGCSVLVTAALENCDKLSAFWSAGLNQAESTQPEVSQARSVLQPPEFRPLSRTDRGVLKQIAHLTARMHGAGLHHQDFYLGHWLLQRGPSPQLFLIDLGRVRQTTRLSRRWIVKDLAQLNFSAQGGSRLTRLRFMRGYLGRPLTAADLPLLRQIERKTRRIARHSLRHRL